MNSITRADMIEVPLPPGADPVCMPVVVMQPTADATDYMLKPNYATNGQPGVVDRAVFADSANPVKHAPTHLPSGSDPIALATFVSAGLMPSGTGQPNDYLGGDLAFHTLGITRSVGSEGDATFDPSLTAGGVAFSGIVNNPVFALYAINEFYLYGANPTYPPGVLAVHFEVFDPAIPGWVQATDSAPLASMTSSTVLVRPILNSLAMTRVWSAQPNSLLWRLVIDTPSGAAAYMRVGAGFLILAGTNPLP